MIYAAHLFEGYTVSDLRRADGTVFGELELKQQRAGAQYHIRGVMACLTATGTTAWLAAGVVYSDHPNVQAGQYLAWTVVDNDVNDHDQHQPDLPAEFFLFDQVAAQLHCDSGLNLAPLYPIQGHLGAPRCGHRARHGQQVARNGFRN